MRVSSDIEPHRLKNRYHISNVGSHDVTARIRDALAPLTDISRSKFFPVVLKNAYTSFTLVDFFALTKCQRSLDRFLGTLGHN